MSSLSSRNQVCASLPARSHALRACDGIDNNCNGDVDDDDADLFAPERQELFPDADGDGFGDAKGESVTSCEPPEGYVADATDCDDEDPARNPGLPEYCDGGDNDCDADTVESGVAYVSNRGNVQDLSGIFATTAPDPDEAYTNGTWATVRVESRGTLYLCPGTYYATIVPEANLSIVGVGGSEETVLDGLDTFPGIWVDAGVDVDVTGLTLQNSAHRESDRLVGAALRCTSSASVTAEDIVVTGGDGQFGGAVSVEDGCALTLRDADLEGGPRALFGGLMFVEGASAVISDTRFADAESALFGGALSINRLATVPSFREASVTCTNCTFEDNRGAIEEISAGGAVAVGPDATFTMEGGSFVGNRSEYAGGALFVGSLGLGSGVGSSQAVLTDVFFDDNTQLNLELSSGYVPNDVMAQTDNDSPLSGQSYYDFTNQTVSLTCDDLEGCEVTP